MRVVEIAGENCATDHLEWISRFFRGVVETLRQRHLVLDEQVVAGFRFRRDGNTVDDHRFYVIEHLCADPLGALPDANDGAAFTNPLPDTTGVFRHVHLVGRRRQKSCAYSATDRCLRGGCGHEA